MPPKKRIFTKGKINRPAAIQKPVNLGLPMRNGNSIAVTEGQKPHKDKNWNTIRGIPLNWRRDKRLEINPNDKMPIKIKQIMRFISFNCAVLSGLIATKKITGIITMIIHPKI
jgi:hypothetical protein